jgi:hypothetical protein
VPPNEDRKVLAAFPESKYLIAFRKQIRGNTHGLGHKGTPMDDKTEKTEKAEKVLAAIQTFQDFADKLTLRRIFTAVLAGALGVLLYTAVENRASIFNTLVAPPAAQLEAPWEVTATTKSELTNLTKTNPLVKMVLVTHVDLRKNRRTPLFWYLDDPYVSVIKQRVANMLPTAVFDDDQKNTEQLVAVLNNNFVCSKFEDTVYQRHFPEIRERMPYICRIAVPPFYGRFVGLLTFGLRAEPTKEQLAQLKLEASRLSIQMYLRDVLRTH